MATTESTPKFMQKLELEYLDSSGLVPDRTRYRIFYSQLVQADLLVLGINPSGDPNADGTHAAASNTYFENWEHDYVDEDYTIASVMFPFLRNILRANKESIRFIPKSNLAFRRSPGTTEFKRLHGMTLVDGMKEAAPIIKQIMEFVQPKMVLLEGTSARDNFRVRYCSDQTTKLTDPIKTEFRKTNVDIFTANYMHVHCLGRELPVVAIGHPSHFGGIPAWGSVQQATRSICERFNIQVKNG